MKTRLLYIGIALAIAVVAVLGALSTPAQQAVAQNPYVVGGELEVPQATGGGFDTGFLVAAVAAVAVAVGAVAAYKLSK